MSRIRDIVPNFGTTKGSASAALNYDRLGFIVRIANILPTVNRSIKKVGNADLMPT